MTSIKIVPKTAPNTPPPPRKLGKEGLSLWNRVQSEFAVVDVGGAELLAQCCASLDRAEALAAIIDRDGETIPTKTGLRVHPAIREETACRAFVCRTIQRLGISLEVVRPMGRPPMRGWEGHDADA
jgi:hypothetical protein